MKPWRRRLLWAVVWLAVFVVAGLLGERRSARAELKADTEIGCVDHEWVVLDTCGTEVPTYLRVDTVIAFGRVEAFGLHSPAVFAGCIGILIANGRTVAVHHTPESFLKLIREERGKWRRCRYKLRQVEVQIEGGEKGGKVDISTGGDKQVDVNIEAP